MYKPTDFRVTVLTVLGVGLAAGLLVLNLLLPVGRAQEPATNFTNAQPAPDAPNPKQASSNELAKLARARLEAARRTFEGYWTNKELGRVENTHIWSRRWLEAQCQVNDRWEDRVAAFQQHLDRMKDLAQITTMQERERLVSVDEVNATQYYVAEAAEWLARAKAEDHTAVKKR